MKKAFNYIFQDNRLLLKSASLLIYIMLIAFSFCLCKANILNKPLTISMEFLGIIFLVFIGFCVVEGYKISVIKSLQRTSNNNVLPFINLKKDFIAGVKYFISFIIFSIPFLFTILAFAWKLGLGWGLNAINQFHLAVSNIAFVLSGLTLLLYIIYLICFLPAILFVFSKTDSIWCFYKFEEILQAASIYKKKYCLLAAFYLISNLVISSFYTLNVLTRTTSLISLLTTMLLSGIAIVYMNFVSCYLVADIEKD